MANFPVLNSGAVTQYPATLVWGRPGVAIRFLDGTDQRYSTRGRALRRWLIDLHLLTETELSNFEAFFQLVSGEVSLFDFPDPFSGLIVPKCRLAAPGLASEYQASGVSSTSFWVIETNG
jgi:hypothetical protein